MAGASAAGVTVERERDTWDSLIATPLTGAEIIRGKAFGAIWDLRGFGGLLSLFWLVGLAAGAIHPLGLLVALLVVGVLSWFVVALGTYASLTCKSTSRALTITIAILLFLNFGYFGVLYPIILVFSDAETWRYSFVGFTPLLASASLLSYQQVASIVATVQVAGRPSGLNFRPVLYGMIVLIGYSIAAAILIRCSLQRFMDLVDRPRRASDVPVPEDIATRHSG